MIAICKENIQCNLLENSTKRQELTNTIDTNTIKFGKATGEEISDHFHKSSRWGPSLSKALPWIVSEALDNIIFRVLFRQEVQDEPCQDN